LASSKKPRQFYWRGFFVGALFRREAVLRAFLAGETQQPFGHQHALQRPKNGHLGCKRRIQPVKK
jgi:hypothetical protein